MREDNGASLAAARLSQRRGSSRKIGITAGIPPLPSLVRRGKLPETKAVNSGFSESGARQGAVRQISCRRRKACHDGLSVTATPCANCARRQLSCTCAVAARLPERAFGFWHGS